MPSEKNNRKSFDFDFKVLKKVTKIPFTYHSKSQKIKIKKIAKRKPRNFTWVYVSLVLVCAFAIFSNTKAFRTISILNSLIGKRSLIGFQNSAELRPTGGFWGSFATLDLSGSIFSPSAKLDIETNVYRKDNLLVKANLDNAPKAVADTFIGRPQTFVNANWDPDFEKAAQTMNWYFGQGWDKPIDNVFAVSSISVIELLKLTGDIELSDGTIISANNFTEIMSKKIDQDYWTKEENKVENEPKKILLEIFPQLEKKLKNQPKLKLAKKVFELLDQKNILIFSNDQNIQRKIKKNNWSGTVPNSTNDFLYVVNANLNGGKSSLNVNQDINLQTHEENGVLVNKLTIKRKHSSDKWPNILNRNYTRVLIPLDAKLISVKDEGGYLNSDQFEAIEEAGKKSIGFWFSTGFGENKSVELTYSLPSFITKNNYNLTLIRQPGTNFDNVSIDYCGKLVNFTLTQDKKITF